MNARTLVFGGLVLVGLIVRVRAADVVDQVTNQAVADYTQRLEAATKELNDTRQRILREQQPLAEANRQLEDRVIALQIEISQLESTAAQKAERRQQLLRDAGNLRRNLNYFTTLAQDAIKTADDSLLPGETTAAGRVQTLQDQLEQADRGPDATVAAAAVDFILERAEQQLGGYAESGSSLIGTDNRLVKGTFGFVGPESFFQGETGTAGTVRTRSGSPIAVTYPIEGWKSGPARRFLTGELGTMFADASGGKALRLQEVNGTLWEHIQRGGVMAYVILAVGLLAIFIALQKLIDIRRFAIDSPAAIEQALDTVRHGAKAELESAVSAMKPTTRELFTTAMRHMGRPKAILEEHLFALTLQMRLHLERRLPLLAVIATAAPLMGLLGTVMGMIKTFALITVFGTGNAGKLSGGISEVLVATELGLMVAVPALIVHAFLAHRIHKDLALLDRYAVELVTAAEEAKQGTDRPAPVTI